MVTAREVVAQALAPHYEEYAESMADAALVALREHWTSDEQMARMFDALFGWRTNGPPDPDAFDDLTVTIRAVIAALFEDQP